MSQRVGMKDSWATADKQEHLPVLYGKTTCNILYACLLPVLTLRTGWIEGVTLACTPARSCSQRAASCLTWARIGWEGHVEVAEGGSGGVDDDATAGWSRAEMASGMSGLKRDYKG